MTMIKGRKGRENGRFLKVTLATSGVLATLMGADLMASKSWLDTVVDAPVASAVLQEALSPMPTIVRSEASLVRQVPSDLPQKVAMPSLDLAPLPTVAVPQGMALIASGQSAAPVSAVTLPQVVVPQIPSAPLFSQTAVSLNLPPIPSVTIPQPVASGKTS